MERHDPADRTASERRPKPHRPRRRRSCSGSVIAVLTVSIGWAALIAPVELQALAADVTFADLQPVLTDRCVMCHGGSSPAAGLRLDTLDGLRSGSRKGPIVKSGDPSGSELIRRLKGTSTPRMPMTGPPFLTDDEIGLFEKWIAAGMPAAPASTAGGSVPAIAPTSARPAPGQPVTYEHVAPIFAARCVKCHTDNGLVGAAPEGFRLTSYEATISPADRARVVPGHPLASQLVRSIRGLARPRMPRDGPPYLSEDEIRLIEDWIRDGARDASGAPAAVPTGARVRLNGTLGTKWSLDGLSLTVSGGTRVDKSPGPGDYVEVRGSVQSDGRISVERLRRR